MNDIGIVGISEPSYLCVCICDHKKEELKSFDTEIGELPYAVNPAPPVSLKALIETGVPVGIVAYYNEKTNMVEKLTEEKLKELLK